MPLSDDELAILKRLRWRLERDLRGHTVEGVRIPGFRSLRAYYKGMQRLEQIGLAVPEDLRKFVTIVAWPRTYVDSVVSRLHPQGFLLDGEADEALWQVWQANDLDSEFRMALVDMLVYGRGYMCVGTNEDAPETPLITVESPLQMIHEWSNRHRRVTAAARFYVEEVDGHKEPRATLYMPDATVWVTFADGKWVEEDRDPHNLGRVPVEPLVNRPTSDDRYGESEMSPIITLTDAAARALTNAQLATEMLAVPARFAAGMTSADFKDPETGEMLTQWESYFGSVWATANKDAKFGQFEAADLKNFDSIVSLYAKLVAGITGLPMRYLGQLSDNPPSADGIRADESRLVSTAEDKQKSAGDSLGKVMETQDLFKSSGEPDPRFRLVATDWRPAGTPSLAQAADAAVKNHAEGLYSRREALRSMGKSPQQIKLIEEELQAEGLSPGVQQILAKVDAPVTPAVPDAVVGG